MKIWYEIEDMGEGLAEEDADPSDAPGTAQACPVEVWEWFNDETRCEAGLVGRFPNPRLAELFVMTLNDRLHAEGRGLIFPRDARQTAVDRFHAVTPEDQTVH